MLIPNTYKKLLKTYVPDKLLNNIKRLHYYRTLKSFNVESEPDLFIVKEFVTEGDLVIDIGANIGVYTRYLSNFVGATGKVMSIEPIPVTYSFLINNIEKLKLLNVETYNVAITEKKYTSQMYIPAGISGENYFRAKFLDMKDNINKMNLRAIEVKCVPLDMLVNSVDRSISFIKIDVEGFEMSVLNGAKKALENNKPSLLVEIDGDPSDNGSNADCVLKFLQAFNYKPYIFIDKKLKSWQVGDMNINYFFFNDYHMKMLMDKGIIN
jgi:FkbM family methyltransferase